MSLFGDPDLETHEIDDGKPSWHELGRTSRLQCHECVRIAYERRRRGAGTPVINRAKWRRRQRGRETLLCSEHAHDRRIEEG